jgi:hypothetical protein
MENSLENRLRRWLEHLTFWDDIWTALQFPNADAKPTNTVLDFRTVPAQTAHRKNPNILLNQES